MIGCKVTGLGDSGGTENIPDQTRILAVYAVPDTIAPSDTAQFKCTILDSTNGKFKFYWYVPHGTSIGGKDTTYGGVGVVYTTGNQIKWKAPIKADLYSFNVTVDDGNKDSLAVEQGFQVVVK